MEQRTFSLDTAVLALAMIGGCACHPALCQARFVPTAQDHAEVQAGEDTADTARQTLPGTMQPARLVQRVNPVYPPKAKLARIQGAVKFTAIITKAGAIENIQTISGHPLLVAAAKDAFKKCIYTPAILNGTPVSMATQIVFPFTLSK